MMKLANANDLHGHWLLNGHTHFWANMRPLNGSKIAYIYVVSSPRPSACFLWRAYNMRKRGDQVQIKKNLLFRGKSIFPSDKILTERCPGTVLSPGSPRACTEKGSEARWTDGTKISSEDRHEDQNLDHGCMEKTNIRIGLGDRQR